MYCVSYPLQYTIPSVIDTSRDRDDESTQMTAPAPSRSSENSEPTPAGPEALVSAPVGPQAPEPTPVGQGAPVFVRTAVGADQLEARVRKLEVIVLFLALASAASTLLLIRLSLRTGATTRSKN